MELKLLLFFTFVIQHCSLFAEGSNVQAMEKFERVNISNGPTFNVSAHSALSCSSQTGCAARCLLGEGCTCFARRADDCYLFSDLTSGSITVTIDTGVTPAWGIYTLNNGSGVQWEEVLSCPGTDWVWYSGSCYYASTVYCTWDSADVKCSSLATGAHLAVITTEEERTFALDLLEANGIGNWAWLGANDRALHGTYVWLNGESFQWNDWLSVSEPTLLVNEDCIMMVTRSDPANAGKFHDYYCNYAYPHLCEVEYL